MEFSEKNSTAGRPGAAHAESPVDWQDLYNRIPDEALIDLFAASFRDSTPRLAASLEASVRDKDLRRIEADAHALKGAAANLGAVPLAKAAWQLELTAREQSDADLQTLFESVQTEFDRLIDLLSHPNWIEFLKLS
jgi:HPt (histidine-containing phosphotransfer) domain-containing protein